MPSAFVVVMQLKSKEIVIPSDLWETVPMKPRRPAVKDSTKNPHTIGAKRKSQQVAAKAARKAAAKKAKLTAENPVPKEDFSQATARIVQEATEK